MEYNRIEQNDTLLIHMGNHRRVSVASLPFKGERLHRNLLVSFQLRCFHTCYLITTPLLTFTGINFLMLQFESLKR